MRYFWGILFSFYFEILAGKTRLTRYETKTVRIFLRLQGDLLYTVKTANKTANKTALQNEEKWSK